MVVDAQGNAFVAGHFVGSALFGTNLLSASTPTDMDIFLVKYDPAGNVLWARRAGGAASDEALGLALDPSGGVYLLGGLNLATSDPIGGGWTYALSGLPATVGDATLTNNPAWAAYYPSLVLARFDPSGGVSWTKVFGATIPNNPSYTGGGTMTAVMCSDPAGNIYLAGYLDGDDSVATYPPVIDFGGLAFTNCLPSAPGTVDYAFSAKFDPSGNIVWLRPSRTTFDAVSFDRYKNTVGNYYHGNYSGIAVDAQENVYLFGDISNEADPGNPAPLVFIIKTDNSGMPLWATTMPAIDAVGIPAPIAVDGSGNSYVAALDFVSKHDPYGHEVGRWTDLVPLALAADPLGGVYVVAAADNLTPFGISGLAAYGWGLFSLDSTLSRKWTHFFPAAGGQPAPLSSAPLGLGPKGELYYAGTFLNELYLGGAWLKSPEAGYDVRDFIMKLVTPLNNALPLITSQPVGDTFVAGDTIKLEVVASSASPLSYQWTFNGQALPGATNRIYVATNVQATAAGSYAVQVGNAQGATNSDLALITIVRMSRLAEALGATNLTWTIGGDRGWRIETNMTHLTSEAAVSGIARHKEEIDFDTGLPIFTENLSSWVQATVPGPGSLTFWWKVSSDTNQLATSTLPGDQLSVTVDGANINSISGDVDWQLKSLVFGPGGHTVQWNYSHFNGSYDSSFGLPTASPRPWIGYDSGWLAEVQFTPDSAGGGTKIMSTQMLRDGSFQISIKGPAAATFGVEASTDLLNWIPVGQVYSDTGAFTFTNKILLNLGKNFYRVRVNP
jgi:hypothetical protein